MSNIQKSERFSFGNPSMLDYCVRPSHHDKMSLNELRAAGVAMDAVDKYNSSGYFYRIQISRDVKKAGHVDPLSLDTGSVNYHCFRYATTSPDSTRDIMDVIKPYRRSHLRLSIYLLLASQPAELLQPVLHFDRGPPIHQTQKE